MLLCIEYDILFVDTVNMKIKASNAFNAMFVNTVNTGVCGSYTTPYAGVKTLHKVQGGSFVNFLGLVKLQG